jgi:hypothetical protein
MSNKRKHKKHRSYGRDYSNVNFSQHTTDRHIDHVESTQLSFLSVVALFIRNKSIELLELFVKIVFGVFCISLLIGISMLLVAGLGWVAYQIPFISDGMKPMYHIHEYASFGLIPVFVLIVAGVAIFSIIEIVTGIYKWIHSNWRKAKQGVRVKLFDGV